MKPFYVYEQISGKILRAGICQDENVDKQAGVGEIAAIGQIGNANYIVAGEPVYVPPPPPTAEQLAAADEAQFMSSVMVKVAKAFYLHENRIRVLEGKPEITWEQFKTAIRSLL